ncbi:HU family DNA-binding protein [Alkaliflexus imshenetskii]|uniref:HU family DNA-binding protein n=1 Tax=Alkaliflexus imshenetskii TaxID=286730 RepID=UPI00047D04F1|nr:HU family DNA-binding protein [Alkaliflexus imshenetskii]
MAIDFKPVEKGQPGVIGGGDKKFYAQIVFGKEATIDELVADIEKFSALSEADIRGVIIALENVIQNKLSQSRVVRLEKLGSLYPSISSNGADTAEKLSANSIKRVSVNYRPGKRIVNALENAGFKKVSQ